ncbi:hypothetical protein VTO42DRAFT_7320 [Malbranchea cinnamomea]
MPPKPVGRGGGDTQSPTPGPASARGGRGGVQRLQSLKRRPTPGGNLVPLNPDGTTPKPTLKYQPKVVQRRSKEEREARERAEAERQREKLAEAAAQRRLPPRGADRGGRGRGRGRGRGAIQINGRDAFGPRGPDGRKVKAEYGRRSLSARPGSGDVSSDESDSELRLPIDLINLSSDEYEEVDGKGKAPEKTPAPSHRGLRPVRVERHEHVERVVDINTEASSSKSAELRREAKKKRGEEDDSLFVEDEKEEEEPDVEEVAARPVRRHETTENENYPQIKKEPVDEDVVMVDTIPQAGDEEIPPEPAAKPKKKISIKDPRSKLQTVEDRQEYDRYEQDIEDIKKALGSQTLTETKSAEGEETETEEKKLEEIKDERHGKLFLFQFPPLTPNLIVPSALTDDHDTVIEIPPPTQSEIHHPRHDPSQHTVAVKAEAESNGEVISEQNSKPKISPLLTATKSDLPPGRVGKLRIHKSGRATIDWGGINFELNKGSDVDFLQDAIVLSEEKTNKRVWAMSQVSGKFVITPDWDKLLEL